jgi:hypothetical protein
MGFLTICVVAALIWLSSIAACLIACLAKRLRTSLIFSLIALAIGYLGMTHFHITASRSVNGRVQWSFNSHWFFVATLVLAALTLAYTIWKFRKAFTPQLNPGAGPSE